MFIGALAVFLAEGAVLREAVRRANAAGNLTIGTWNTTVSTGPRTLRLLGAGNGEIVNWTSVASNVPVTGSHTRALPSAPAVATREPSGLNRATVTLPL